MSVLPTEMALFSLHLLSISALEPTSWGRDLQPTVDRVATSTLAFEVEVGLGTVEMEPSRVMVSWAETSMARRRVPFLWAVEEAMQSTLR